MTRNSLLRPILLTGLCLFALSGCTHPQSTAAQSRQRPPTETMSSDDCGARASSRLALYDKPDTYPMSRQQRQDAYNALYDECKRGYNEQLAKPNFAPSSTIATADLATLSPAAGGNPPAAIVTTAGAGAYPPGATVVVINGNTVSQLSSLSPSSGGKTETDGVNVVVVQPTPALPAPVAVTARPVVAMPLTPPPLAVGHAAYPPPAPQPPTARMVPSIPASAPPVATAYSYPPASAQAASPTPGGSGQLENIILKN